MAPRLDKLDLSTLGLAPGAGRRLELEVGVGALEFGGEHYAVDPDPVPVTLEISRLSGPGFALRLRLECVLRGPCMRCLKDAGMPVEVDAREVEAARLPRAPAGATRRTSWRAPTWSRRCSI